MHVSCAKQYDGAIQMQFRLMDQCKMHPRDDCGGINTSKRETKHLFRAEYFFPPQQLYKSYRGIDSIVDF